MSFYQNQGRKLTQKEIDYWEKLAVRIMSESLHWREFYFKRRDLREARERGVLSNGDLRVREFELQEWCN